MSDEKKEETMTRVTVKPGVRLATEEELNEWISDLVDKVFDLKTDE